MKTSRTNMLVTAVITVFLFTIGFTQAAAVPQSEDKTKAQLERSTEEVTGEQYGVRSQCGSITVKAGNAEKIYDGYELKSDKYTVEGNLAEGDHIEVQIEGSRTFAGTAKNVIKGVKIMRGHENVTSRYAIKTEDGTLAVQKRNVVITAASDSKIYDGSPLENRGFNTFNLAETDTVESATVAGSITDKGTTENKVRDAVIRNGRDDATGSYNISYVFGKLIITERTLIIRAGSLSKAYDGKPLTCSEYTCEGLAGTDSVGSVLIKGSQTFGGSSSNIASGARILRNGLDVTRNYDMEYCDGLLVVNGGRPGEITVISKGACKTYDGKPLSCDRYGISGKLCDGDEVEVQTEGSITNVGSVSNKIRSCRILHRTGQAEDMNKLMQKYETDDLKTIEINGETFADVTDYYKISLIEGQLKVVKRPATVIAGSSSKVYDGRLLTDHSCIVKGLADGQTYVSVQYEGSQTEVGESCNRVTGISFFGNGENVTDNYKIQFAGGRLAVVGKQKSVSNGDKDKTAKQGCTGNSQEISSSHSGSSDKDKVLVVSETPVKAVQTGDLFAATEIFILLICIAVVAIAGIVLFRKKKN